METTSFDVQGKKNAQVDERPVDFEDVMKELGSFGRYQKTQLIGGCMAYQAFVFMALGFVFTGYSPGFRCQQQNETNLFRASNLTNDDTARVTYKECSITVTSNRSGLQQNVASFGCDAGYEYEGGKYFSMVTEWDLVCEKAGLIELVQSIMYVGNAVGVFLWTSVADRFSRKYVLMLTLFITLVTELGLFLVKNVIIAMIFRFFSGFCLTGAVIVRYVIAEELFVSKYRQIFGACDSLWWGFNVITLSGVAFLLRHNTWRHLQLVTVMLIVLSILLSFLTKDTPVWLYAKGRYKEAKKVLTHACRQNGKDVRKVLGLFTRCTDKGKGDEAQLALLDKATRYSALDIFRHRRIFTMTAISVVCFMTVSFSYHALYLTSSALAGNRYLNFFIMSSTDIPGAFVYMVMLSYLGRRTVLIFFFAMSSISFFITVCILGAEGGMTDSFAITTLYFAGKFSINICYYIIYVYTAEMYPTAMRATVVGICTAFGDGSIVFAPYLSYFYKLVPWGPGLLLGLSCGLCGFLLFFLPETRGRALPATIEDVLAWRNSKTHKRQPENKLEIADNEF